MSTPEPTVRVTRYEVTCLPPDHIDASVFTITVEWRGGDRWAVTRATAHLDAHGNRSWGVAWEDGREPVTDEELASHEDARQRWLDAHRFDEDTALRIAREHAPKIVVNGRLTVEMVLADIAAREAIDG